FFLLLSLFSVFSFMLLRPPISTLFPYTTLFRSGVGVGAQRCPERLLRARQRAAVQPLRRSEGRSSSRSISRRQRRQGAARPPRRSEEHTSELQSRENLVCRLLLEKKKNNKVTDK